MSLPRTLKASATVPCLRVGKDYKSLSPELVGRLGRALELPPGYFPEERQHAVVERIKEDAGLRDELYRRLFGTSG